MACLTNVEKQKLRDDIAALDLQIAALNEAIKNSSGIESYKFDSGEGSQTTKYRSLTEMIDTRDCLNAERNRLCNILGGKGLANMRLRRFR